MPIRLTARHECAQWVESGRLRRAELKLGWRSGYAGGARERTHPVLHRGRIVRDRVGARVPQRPSGWGEDNPWDRNVRCHDLAREPRVGQSGRRLTASCHCIPTGDLMATLGSKADLTR